MWRGVQGGATCGSMLGHVAHLLPCPSSWLCLDVDSFDEARPMHVPGVRTCASMRPEDRGLRYLCSNRGQVDAWACTTCGQGGAAGTRNVNSLKGL